LRLWAAQTVSSFGARITREGFAMAAILSIHARPTQLGLLAALTLAPGAVVGVFAGGAVDRSSRRAVMIGADLFRTAVLLTIPLAAWFTWLAMPQLYVAAALIGAANVLFDIADHAFLPSLIDREHLVEGNTKLGVTDSLAEIGGPALAGTLYQLFSAPLAMLGTAITYFISACLLFTVPAMELPPEPREDGHRWFHDIRDGFTAVMAQPLVRPLFYIAAASPLFGGFFSALYMIYSLKVLALSPVVLGAVIATGGLGALCGAGLSSLLVRRLGVGRAIVLCGIVSAFLAFLIPLASGPLWLRITAMAITQFGGDAFAVAMIIPSISLRQAVLPPGMLGRTAALFSAAYSIVAVAGALIGGALGAFIGIRETLFIAAAGYVLTPLFVLFSPLRRVKEIPS
jgi:MFS family permease